MQATHHRATDASTTPAVVLRCAAEYIRRHGHTQGAFFDPDSDASFPPACATGAIRMAIHGDLTATFAPTAPDSQEHRLAVTTQRILAGYLDESFDPEETSSIDAIGDWNDEEGRTPAEVITTLTDAADDWDRTHRPPGEQP
jgi:hypothetical protein